MVCVLSCIPGPRPRCQQHPQLLQPNQLQTQQLTSLLTPVCSPVSPRHVHTMPCTRVLQCVQHMHSAGKDFQTYFNGCIIVYSVHVSQFSHYF